MLNIEAVRLPEGRKLQARMKLGDVLDLISASQNREKVAEGRKRYREQNREKLRAYMREYQRRRREGL